MKDEIMAHLDNPGALEKMYRSNKGTFRQAFGSLYPELRGNTLADVWNERLNYESEEGSWGSPRELAFVIVLALLAGVIAKLPAFLGLSEDFYYPRNMGFVLFPALSAYFAWQNKLSLAKGALIAGSMLAALLFINFLPQSSTSDTLVLSCVHLLLFLWSILGFAFVGSAANDSEKRLGYLKYNGDLVVITTLIVIAGAILSATTVGLFSVIGFRIERFYFENIVVFALPAAPILGTFLTQTNPHLVGRVSPVIARIFSPLVLAMQVIYLVAMVNSGKNPYNDRDFLLIFNALLVGVMAIIFFSVAERSRAKSSGETWVLFLLSSVTIIVNGIALSAILFRISEWGFTPNRAAILGGNVLILVNLLLVTAQLFKVLSTKSDVTVVGKTISWYLPVYVAWTIIVTFIFPFVFNFR